MTVNVKGFLPQMALVRHLECTAGEVVAQVRFDPRLGLPGRPPRWNRRGNGVICEWGALAMLLQYFGVEALELGTRVSTRMGEAQRLTLIASLANGTQAVFIPSIEARMLMAETDRDWRWWAA